MGYYVRHCSTTPKSTYVTAPVLQEGHYICQSGLQIQTGVWFWHHRPCCCLEYIQSSYYKQEIPAIIPSLCLADEFNTFYTRFEMSPVSSHSPWNGRVRLHTAIIKRAQGWMFVFRLLCKLKISSNFFQRFTEPLLRVSSHHPSLCGSQQLCQRLNKVSNTWYVWPGGSHARSKCLWVFFITKVLKKLASRIVVDPPIHPGHFLFSRLPSGHR